MQGTRDLGDQIGSPCCLRTSQLRSRDGEQNIAFLYDVGSDGGSEEALQPLLPGSHPAIWCQNQPRGPRFDSNTCSINELDNPCDSDKDNKNGSLRNLHLVLSAKKQGTLQAAVSAKHCSIMASNDVLVLGIYLRWKML